MSDANVLNTIERLNFALSKVEDFEISEINLSERVLDNRIITLEGYLRFLEREAMPKLKRIYETLGSE